MFENVEQAQKKQYLQQLQTVWGAAWEICNDKLLAVIMIGHGRILT
jgi:hypothetical protein